MQHDELVLVEALQRGEPRACDQLVQQYAARVYSLALRLTKNPNEAEEVRQETFINACRAADTFEGRSALATWLYRIATNSGLMRLRRRELDTVPLDGLPEQDEIDFQLGGPRDLAAGPEEVLLTADLRAAVEEAITSLPESLRAAVVLRDVEGLSSEEAAAVLGISSGALKVRLHRARGLLRERLTVYVADTAWSRFAA
ncbi:MAG: sigma-70 family RNA polymerase sigma factor [Anaerolineae bacterium]